MSKITIEQKFEENIEVLFSSDINQAVEIEQRERGVACVDKTIYLEPESIPALISALDPERDKRNKELERYLKEFELRHSKNIEHGLNISNHVLALQSQLEEAKNQLQEWSDKMGYSKDGNLAKIIEKLNTKQP